MCLHKGSVKNVNFTRFEQSSFLKVLNNSPYAFYIALIMFGMTLMLCLLDVVEAESRVRKVNFLYLESPGVMPMEVTTALVKDVRRKLAKAGVRIKTRITRIGTAESFPFENRDRALDAYRFNFKRYARAGEFNHFLTGPFVDVTGKGWMVGFANISRDYSLSTARITNDLGEDRYWQSVNGVVHELGHSMLNLQHDNGSCELMNIGVLVCPNQQNMGFSRKSLRGIR